MLEIIRITGRNNNPKTDLFNYIQKIHSTYGEFIIEPEIGVSFFFKYYDDISETLVSSIVQDIDYVETDKLYIITTLNSIYYIKEV